MANKHLIFNDYRQNVWRIEYLYITYPRGPWAFALVLARVPALVFALVLALAFVLVLALAFVLAFLHPK